MKELIIGRAGFIGGMLSKMLPDASAMARPEFDLLEGVAPPEANIIYLCAGVNGAKNCEGNAEAFRTNVDGTIELCRNTTAFVVWISSMTVEWANTAYARHKLTTETVLRTLPNVHIVRAGRVTKDNVVGLCNVLIKRGRDMKPGLSYWGSDDIAYYK